MSDTVGHRLRRFIGGRPGLRRHGKGDHPIASLRLASGKALEGLLALMSSLVRF
jgi:hypothetical protein